MRILLITILTLRVVFGVEYYIDFVGGDNANTGASEAQAWKHHPWDVNASGASLAAAATLDLSSTNYFKGGVSYGSGPIYLRSSGTSAAEPMIWTSKSGWGAGIGKFDPTNTVSTIFMAATSTGSERVRDNHSFIGLEFYRVGGYTADDPILSLTCANPVTAPAGGSGIVFSKGCNGIVVKDCHFHEIGQWRNQPPFSGVNSITGSGVSLEGALNTVIISNFFTRMRVGISVKSAGLSSTNLVANVTVSSNHFNDYMVWPMDIAPRSADGTFSNLVVGPKNTFNNMARYDSGNWLGCGEKPHTDEIFLRNAGLSGIIWTNSNAGIAGVHIYNNNFFCDQPMDSKGGTAAMYNSEGPSMTFEGNLVIGPPKSPAMVAVGHRAFNNQRVIVRNNTIWGTFRPFQTVVNSFTDGRTRFVEFYNNLIIRNGGGDSGSLLNMGTNNYSFVDMHHNAYLKVGFPSTTLVFAAYDHDGDGSYSSTAMFATHQANGFDANSIYTTDPMLDVGLSYGTTPSLGNYRPIAGSPLIGIGMYTNNLTADMDGKARANPPTIGAFEYTIITDPPNTPTGLTAAAISTSQINLTWNDVASETGYKLERKTGLGGTYVQIATPAANAASYGDSGLTQSTTYYYRLRATNGAGDSGYSNEANATTLAPSDPPPPSGEITNVSGKPGRRNRR